MSKTVKDIITQYGGNSFCSVTVKKEKSASGYAGTLTELVRRQVVASKDLIEGEVVKSFNVGEHSEVLSFTVNKGVKEHE